MIPPLLALLSWPAIVAMLGSSRGIAGMICLSVIGGYLFLPVEGGLDLPLLPAFDKVLIPSLVAMIGASMMASGKAELMGLPGWVPRSPTLRVMLLAVVIGAFLTVMTNGDNIPYLDFFLPALTPYDAFSYVLTSMVMLLPLLIGRKYLASPENQRLLLVALCLAALIYTPLVLYEVRMSPQLSAQIYGFFPHSWIQHIRGDGYRPIVFLEHGLRLAIFLTAAVIAAAGLSRIDASGRRPLYLMACLWLMAVLVLAKSLGALIIGIVLCGAVFLLPSRMQMLLAAVLVSAVVLYPILRSAGLVPVEWMLQTIAGFNPERAASLGIRFQFESLLLERAQLRPVFGWGGNGRSLLLTERTIPDGQWVITLGVFGWTGFLALFGLLSFPVIFLWWSAKRIQYGPETVILALILAGSVVDLVPNSGMNPVLWLTAGALWGRLELGAVRSEEDAETAQTAPAEDTPARPGFTRGRPTPAAPATGAAYTRQQNRFERNSA